MDFFKKYGNGIMVIAIALLLFFLTGLNKGCGGGKIITSDTVYVHDTIPGKDSSYPIYIPKPYPLDGTDVQLPPKYIILPADTAALKAMINDLVKRHYAVNTYSDSFDLKDSSGRSVAMFRIKDTVSENLIKKRAPGYTIKPRISDTVKITNNIVQDSKFQVYWGLGLLGNTHTLTGISGGLIFKDKKDNITQAKIGAIKVGGKIEPQFELTKYFKIKLNK